MIKLEQLLAFIHVIVDEPSQVSLFLLLFLDLLVNLLQMRNNQFLLLLLLLGSHK